MNQSALTNLGRYRVIERLGQGGMATVFKAFDQDLERTVAIKVILQNEMHTPEFLARFKREARTLARLSHPNIVKILDYGEQDGLPYLVMEFINDGSLATKRDLPMPYQQAARLLLPVARALSSAHRLGIVHRDVKPANILLSEEGEPLLSDFGISKMIEMHETAELTSPGFGIGTPEYMAPEQSLGGNVDFRADIYSLGVVFYELVTSLRPFTAETPLGVLIKHHNTPLPPPSIFAPGLDKQVEQVIIKMLAKQPEQRFSSMDDVVSILSNIANGIPFQLDGDAAAQLVVATQQFSSDDLDRMDTVPASTSPPQSSRVIVETLPSQGIGEVEPAGNGNGQARVGSSWQVPPGVEPIYGQGPSRGARSRRLFFILGALLLLLVSAGVVFGRGLFSPKIITVTGEQVSTPPVEFATVQDVDGLVEILSSGGSHLKLSRGMRLMVGGPFRLKSTDGEAQLALVDGSMVCLPPGSEVEFLNVAGGSTLGLEMSLLAGRFLYIGKEKGDTLFTITNPLPVTISSQGAIIGLEANPNGLGRLDLDCLFGTCSFVSTPARLDLINPGHTILEAAGLFADTAAARMDVWSGTCPEIIRNRMSGASSSTRPKLLGIFPGSKPSATVPPTLEPTNTSTPDTRPSNRFAPAPTNTPAPSHRSKHPSMTPVPLADGPTPTNTNPPDATATITQNGPTPTNTDTWPTPTQSSPINTPTLEPSNTSTFANSTSTEPSLYLAPTDTPTPPADSTLSP